MAPSPERLGDEDPVSAMEMGRAWLGSGWPELLPEEATWIYLLAVSGRREAARSVRDAVHDIDPDAAEWLDRPVTSHRSMRGTQPPATVAELALRMRDLGLVRTDAAGWRAAWPLPVPPGD